MVGRRILVPEVGVRVPVPQLAGSPPQGGFFVVRADNACDSESKDFVRTHGAACAAFATVTEPRDTSGTALARRREPCPRDGGQILKALAMGVCALILLVLPATAQSQSDADLGAQLTRHLSTMKKDQQVLTFLQNHTVVVQRPPLCGRREAPAADPHDEPGAHAEEGCGGEDGARAPRSRCAGSPPYEAATPAHRHLPRLRRPLPGGTRRLALRVRPAHRRPERPVPRPVPDGLERAAHLRPRLDSAVEQATAAHRYFVASGRDWGPWSCKPWS